MRWIMMNNIAELEVNSTWWIFWQSQEVTRFINGLATLLAPDWLVESTLEGNWTFLTCCHRTCCPWTCCSNRARPWITCVVALIFCFSDTYLSSSKQATGFRGNVTCYTQIISDLETTMIDFALYLFKSSRRTVCGNSIARVSSHCDRKQSKPAKSDPSTTARSSLPLQTHSFKSDVRAHENIASRSCEQVMQCVAATNRRGVLHRVYPPLYCNKCFVQSCD